jgi:hypothetical protein
MNAPAMHGTHIRRACRLALSAAALGILAACEGGNSEVSRLAARCVESRDSVLSVAVGQYLKTVQPTPRRFVIPVGTGPDSLPEAGRRALNSAGPTFLYPADSASRSKIETYLLSRGDWPTLLVALRGVREESDSSIIVRLGGRWVSGELDEQPVPTRSVRVACRANRWTFDRAEDERSS